MIKLILGMLCLALANFFEGRTLIDAIRYPNQKGAQLGPFFVVFIVVPLATIALILLLSNWTNWYLIGFILPVYCVMDFIKKCIGF